MILCTRPECQTTAGCKCQSPNRNMTEFEMAIAHPPARGIGRVADNDRAIVLYFDRPLTDDEMRIVHDRLRGWPT